MNAPRKQHTRRPLAQPLLSRWLRRRRRVSRGQALVETALFFTILMLMVAGATNISTLLTDHLNIVYAARQAARIGSTLGASSTADCGIVGAVQAALAGDGNISLSQIIIYQSNANGAPTSVSNEEIYTGATQCNITTNTLSTGPTLNNWPASRRNNSAFLEDSVGVELDYRYTFQLNLLGTGSFLASDHAVAPIEPMLNPTPTPSDGDTDGD